MHLAAEVEDSLRPARMGSVVNALTNFVDTKMETSDDLKEAQDDSVIVLAYAKGTKFPAKTVLVKLGDLGAVGPEELGTMDAAGSEWSQQTMVLDQAIAAASESLHYISGAGLTPETVMRAKITGARPFRKLVRKGCGDEGIQCRKQKSEELLCAMTKIGGSNLKSTVELEATAAAMTCQLNFGLSGLPAKVREHLEASPAAATALSQEGAKTRLAADAALEVASRSEQELKATDASRAGFGIMHGLEKPQADEEWVQVDNLVRSMLKLLDEKDAPEEWPNRMH